MDFLNPGLLGGRSRLPRPLRASHRALQRPGQRRPACAAWSRPFILRRLKTDPTIIQDLPEKQEMKVYCTLTREQATLYEAVVRDALEPDRGGGATRWRGAGRCWGC